MPFDQIWNEVPLKIIDKEGKKANGKNTNFVYRNSAELKIIKEMAFELGNEDFFSNFGNFW